MEQLQVCRINVMELTSISSFAHVRGGVNRGCRDVYFVRAIGRNENLETEVLEMDRQLQAAEAEGKGFYRRVQKLPGQLPYEDSVFYAGCCDEWIQEGRIRIQTKLTPKAPPGFGELLARACGTVEKLYLEDNPRASGSMGKNLIVKLLFWFDVIFREQMFGSTERMMRKLVVCNVEKKQEYLFCYLVALTGCDVLLLQTKSDISCSEPWKKLSSSFVLGAFSGEELPPCETDKKPAAAGPLAASPPSAAGTSAASPPSEGISSHPRSGIQTCPQTQIQSRAGTQGYPQNQAQPQSGMIRVVIPERRRRGQKQENAAGNGAWAQSGAAGGTMSPGQGGSVSETMTYGRSGAFTGAGSPGQRERSAGAPGCGGTVRAEKSYEELAQLASSVVMIALHDRSGEVIGTGSGIMIGKKGYILTNHHVANGGCYYSVKIEEDDKVYTTDEMIKYNPVLDLAVIRIQRALCPLPIYQGAGKLVRGQRVVAIGSPLGLFNSVSDGIISGFRKVDNVDMIQFTAPTSHGSSGGAVLNLYGEVIGISTAGFDAGQNLNLAVGYEYIRTFVQGFTT